MSSCLCEKECIDCKHMWCFFFFGRGKNFYTEDEDKALLDFIMQSEKYDRTGGVRLWMLMEQKQVVPGKSTSSDGSQR